MLTSTITTASLRNCFANLPQNWCDKLYREMKDPSSIALQLSSPNVCLSWSGIASHRGLELDYIMAKNLSLCAGQEVKVSFLYPKKASRIYVEPTSSDSWEIIESNAGWLEDQLMTQIRIVSEGQTFPVWVYSSAISIRVGIFI